MRADSTDKIRPGTDLHSSSSRKPEGEQARSVATPAAFPRSLLGFLTMPLGMLALSLVAFGSLGATLFDLTWDKHLKEHGLVILAATMAVSALGAGWIYELKRGYLSRRPARDEQIPAASDAADLPTELLDHSDEAVIVVDKGVRARFCNQRAIALFKREFRVLNESGRTLDLPGFLSERWNELLNASFSEHPWCARRFDPLIQRWFDIRLVVRDDGYLLYLRDTTEHVAQETAQGQIIAHYQIVRDLDILGDWEYCIASERLTLSAAAMAILGVTDKSPENHLFLTIKAIRSKDRLKLTRALLGAASGEERANFDIELLPGEQGIRVISVSMRCVMDPNGKPAKVIGILRDITSQRMREASLRESQAFVRGVLDTLPHQICVIDESGQLQMVNQRWHESPLVDDFPGGQGRGKGNYFDLCSSLIDSGCEDIAYLLAGIETVISGQKQSFRCECGIRQATSEKYFDIHVNHLKNATGDVGRKLIAITHEEITASRRLLKVLERQQKHLRLVYETTSDGLWDYNLVNEQTDYSDAFNRLFGLTGTEVPPAFPDWLGVTLHELDRDSVLDKMNQAIRDSGAVDLHCRLKIADGSYRWYRLRGKCEVAGNRPVRFLGSLTDIQEQETLVRLLANRERRIREIDRYIPDVFWDFDIAEKKLDYVSTVSYEKIWKKPLPGSSTEMYRQWLESIHPDDVTTVKLHFRTAMASSEQYSLRYRIYDGEGSLKWIESRGYPVTNPQGETVRLVGLARDVTESRLMEIKLNQMATLDPLTELPNRKQYFSNLESYCRDGESHDDSFVLVHLAIDRFGTVNESLGAQAGDQLLIQVGKRLKHIVQNDTQVARIGNGEFAVILPVGYRERELRDALDNITQVFHEPYTLADQKLRISASLGVVRFPEDGADAEQLSRCAAVALHKAQAEGGDQYRFFDQALGRKVTEEFRLLSELRVALEEGQFVLFYQAKVATGTGRITGCEALIRWNSPHRGLVPPGLFMPLLEESNLVVPVGDWVLDESLRQLGDWQHTHSDLDDMQISVNVSARQLSDPAFPDRVAEAIARHRVDPKQVELELTESALMRDVDFGVRQIQKLKALGVRVAVDDFGTGYSSLSYFTRFEPDTLKIDKSFIDDIETDMTKRNIVRGIIDLSHSLDVLVVAEGVENHEQVTLLKQLQCDLIQGYIYSRPVPAGQLAEFVESFHRQETATLHNRFDDEPKSLMHHGIN